MQTSFFSTTNIVGIVITAFLGFIIGLIIRYVINRKLDKKKVRLENKMLNAHTRILELEKKRSDLERKNAAN